MYSVPVGHYCNNTFNPLHTIQKNKTHLLIFYIFLINKIETFYVIVK